ncbi:universal stress protein Slr1101-like [Hydractinia symbiolongicarpus]|uniref:universal stress protein Slr1101-like n=1 Tax=Hydractinia symbiolongicarpus TaxID=13093 RepID=UPI00255023B6|nr:universal stress protein Slr1101-like [Hydractinia symbiolongicarpus]
MAEASGKKLKAICIDGSEHSERALKWFFDNVYHEGDEVALIHVHVLPDLPSFGIYAGGIVATEIYQETVEESIKHSKVTCEKYKELCAAKGVTPKIFAETMEDSIGHTICKIAKEHHAYMIIIGQRGLGAIRRTLFGSVSDYVLHHAHVPVVVVPSEDKDKSK